MHDAFCPLQKAPKELTISQELMDRLVRMEAAAISPAGEGKDNKQESAMNEQDFHGKLTELMGEISALPTIERDKAAAADQTRQRHEQVTRTVSSLQESLDYLRLSIKYLVFDLEATRRENGYLRKMLEQASNNGQRSA